MALPTISNNSPSAGFIAWTAFGIAYNGVSYSIAASNTNLAFTIWKYNGGSPTVVKTNTFPNDLTADDQILFLNKGGVGALVPMTDVLDGSLVVPGSIIANSIAANTIQAYHVNANSINAIHVQSKSIGAEQITANSITGDELAFNSITTEHLGIGSVGDNLATNGSFEEVVPSTSLPRGWVQNAWTNGTIGVVSGVNSSGNNSLEFAPTSTASDLRVYLKSDKYIPVTATSGRKYYVSVMAGASVATTKGFYLRVNWYNASKSTVGSVDLYSNIGMSTVFDLYAGQATPPSTARYMTVCLIWINPNVLSTLYVDEVVVREVIVSAIIGDGQITSPLIKGNAILANHIGVNIISANHIMGNSINASHLLVSDFTNLIHNAKLQSGLAGWDGLYNATIAETTSAAGEPALKLTATSSTLEAQVYSEWVDVVPGEKIRLSYTTEGTWNSGNAAIYGSKKNAAGVIASFSPGTTGATTPGDKGGFVFIVPADAVQIRFRPYISSASTAGTYAIFSNMLARRMTNGELIVDGAITTDHITTNTLNANVLLANTITANKIGFEEITGNHILSNTVNTIHIKSNSITTNELGTNAITSKHIGTNTLNANVILTNSITTAQLGANVVTAVELGANAVTAKHISAGSIGANRLVVGSAANGLADSTFAIPEITASRMSRSTGTWVEDVTLAGGTPSLSHTTTGTNDQFHYSPINPVAGSAGNGIQVSAGQKWRLEVDVETDISAGVRFNIYRYNADGTYSYVSLSGYNTAVGRRQLAYTYTIPAGTIAFDVALACNTTGAKWTVYGNGIVALQSSSTLIEDGAITTPAIAANAIVSNKIATNAISANHINANAITAIHLNANAIDGKTITGATIIGGEIKTTVTANAIAARMGPVSAYDKFTSTPRAGMGFSKTGSAGQGPALFSTDGYDLSIIQGSVDPYDGQQTYLTLQNAIATLYGYSQTNITGRAGCTVSGQNGELNLNGTGVKANGRVIDGGFAEWSSTQAGVPNATTWGVGAPTIVSNSRVTDPTMGTWSSDVLTMRDAGYYMITWSCDIGAAATGRSFHSIESTGGTAIYGRTSMAIGENWNTVTALVHVTGGAGLKFKSYQTTGATRTQTHQIRAQRTG